MLEIIVLFAQWVEWSLQDLNKVYAIQYCVRFNRIVKVDKLN